MNQNKYKLIKVFYYQLMHKEKIFWLRIKISIKITIAASCFFVITIIREPRDVFANKLRGQLRVP